MRYNKRHAVGAFDDIVCLLCLQALFDVEATTFRGSGKLFFEWAFFVKHGCAFEDLPVPYEPSADNVIQKIVDVARKSRGASFEKVPIATLDTSLSQSAADVASP